MNASLEIRKMMSATPGYYNENEHRTKKSTDDEVVIEEERSHERNTDIK
jgi:hypothetical protein